MKTTITVLQWLVRLSFLVLLVLGIAFWTGHGLSLIAVHTAVGTVLVLALWTTAGLAAAARAPGGLVAAGFIWGIVVIAFGMNQMSILPGSSHWIIQVLHLLVGMAAVGLNERLSRTTQERLANHAGQAA
jgi:hypothetical protein